MLSSLLQPPSLVRWAVFLGGFFLIVMSLLRLAAYLSFGDVGAAGQVGAAFWLGLRFDARVVAALVLPLLALGAIPVLNPFRSAGARRLWLALFAAGTATLVVFYVGDFLHYRYLGQRLNASALGFLADAGISSRMLWESYPVVRIGLAMAVAFAGAMAVIVFLHRRAAAAEASPRPRGRGFWLVAMVLACVVAIFGRLGQYPLRWSDAFNLRDPVSAQLALNPVESFTSSLQFRRIGYEPDKVRQDYPRVAEYLGVSRPDAARLTFARTVPPRAAMPAGRRPNIVLVLCESFSGYKSSMWGNPLDTTPFFHSLAREGVFFDNCFTPHFGTARGVWALITGIPDVSPVGTASRNPAMVDQHTIVNEFAGYEKLYFLGGSSSWANIRGLLTNNIAGLKLYEENSYSSPRIDVWGISDKNLFLEADKVLRAQTQPFFAVIQTADNHRPYTIPKEDLGEFQLVDVPAETFRRHGFESLAELNAFRYTDFAFKKFFEAARQAPYFDDTIFVFIGDHGIGGDAGTAFPAAWTANHLTRYHVPLLFYAPKFLPAQRVHSVSSMVDVLPTVAGLAGIPYRNTTLGRDLLEQQRRDGGASNAAFIVDHNDRTIGVVRQHHYAVQKPGGGREVVWSDFTKAEAAGRTLVPADAAEHHALATALYETARYMLLHNPKPIEPTRAARRLTQAP